MHDAAARDLDDIEQAVADVDAHHEHDLLQHPRQPGREAAIDLCGIADPLAMMHGLDGAPAELERRGHAGGTCVPDPGDLRQLVG